MQLPIEGRGLPIDTSAYTEIGERTASLGVVFSTLDLTDDVDFIVQNSGSISVDTQIPQDSRLALISYTAQNK